MYNLLMLKQLNLYWEMVRNSLFLDLVLLLILKRIMLIHNRMILIKNHICKKEIKKVEY